MKSIATLSITDSKKIKGLAIFLMLMHHLWSFPARIYGSEIKYFFDIFGTTSFLYLGFFGKICISLFFFVSGYGIYSISSKKDFTILRRIKKLYINYWKVFLVFIPIAVLLFNKQSAYCLHSDIYARYVNVSFTDIINNFLGFSFSLNSEWWFFNSYLVAVITFPLIKKLFSKFSTEINISLIIIMSILMANVLPNIPWINTNYLYIKFFCQCTPYISCFWIGVLFAKDNLYSTLKNKIEHEIKLNIITDIIGFIIIIYLRQNLIGPILDFVYVPFLIVFFLDILNKFKYVSKGFEILGNHSTNMWLIHSFLCYYFGIFSRAVMYFKWAVPCLIVLIIMSLIASIIIDYIWKCIAYLFSKFLKVVEAK